MNVSQLHRTREILLDQKNDIIKRIVSGVSHPNPIRKRGCIGTLKYENIAPPHPRYLFIGLTMQELLF